MALARLRSYVSSVLIAADTFCNVVICGEFYTVSSRAMIGELDGVWYWHCLYVALDWIQPQHCEMALRGDIGRAEATLQSLNLIRARLP